MARERPGSTEDAAMGVVARAAKARGEAVAVFAIPARAGASARLMREHPNALVGTYDSRALVRDVEGDLLDTNLDDAK